MKKNDVIKLVVAVVLICIFAYLAIFGLNIGGKQIVNSAADIKTGLDISGGVTIVYEAKKDGQVNTEELNKAVAVLRSRLERKNIYDAVIRPDESKGYIYVEVPANVKDKTQDPLSIVDGLDKTAVIEFRDPDGNIILSGPDIKSAKYSEEPTDNTGIPDPHVVLTFNDEGKQKFVSATERLAGRTMPIYLDGACISEPYVPGKIDNDSAIITMGKSNYAEKSEEAKTQAMLIDSGALPFSLEVINKEYIGPTIGQQALEVSIVAGIIGLIAVMLFMIIVYRLPGIVASISLIAYVALDLLILSTTGITLTLPGIAGIILSIGMAVDANVIIFERFKEELKGGRGPLKAFENSFARALQAIIDGNVTTLIIAIFLYIFGIGTIKGFGIVLGIGVLLSMFTAVFVTKFLLKTFINLASKHKNWFAVKEAK